MPSNIVRGAPNTISVPGSRQTATFGCPIAANPRVIELLNFVATRLVPDLGGPVRVVQTIVTHRRHSPSSKSGISPGPPASGLASPPRLEGRKLTLSLRDLHWHSSLGTCEGGCAEFAVRPMSNHHRFNSPTRAGSNISLPVRCRHLTPRARARCMERLDMIRSWPCAARRSMDWDAYVRQQAAMYRQLVKD